MGKTKNAQSIFMPAILVCAFALLACAMTSDPAGSTQNRIPTHRESLFATEGGVLTGDLKILTLNMAHGRKEGLNQLLQSERTIRQNLADIAAVLKRTGVDVVALQEADGPSRWSGNFDHVAFIADQAGYPWVYRAAHAKSWLFTYGTAILSRFPILETIEHTFKPSPPTFNKGFLLGCVMWRPDPKVERTISIDIVSVHLDFSRKSLRRQQIIEITSILSKRSNPIIILGDFNSEWFSDGSVVKQLADAAHMKVYQPDAKHLQTYLKRGKRLDWIIISNELDFVSYEVLPDVISDHQVVMATIGWIQR